MKEHDPSRVLAKLAKNLSIEKLFADFPSLTSGELKEILLEASRALQQKGAACRKKEPSSDDLWVINVDGASRGNPGPAGAGAILRCGSERVELKQSLGNTTNNVAEYEALIMALEEALRRGARRIEVQSDSELLALQMNGAYRVKSPHLLPLFNRACELAKKFEEITIYHIDRSLNGEADRLANMAVENLQS